MEFLGLLKNLFRLSAVNKDEAETRKETRLDTRLSWRRKLTAEEGLLEWVHPAALAYDADAKLYLMTSGTDIDTKGCSRIWEYFYRLPNKHAFANFTLITELAEADDRFEGHVLREVLNPFVELQSHLFHEKENGQTLKELWESQMSQVPELPMPFKDSPRAVVELAGQGVDFTNLRDTSNLVAKTVEDEPVWEIYYYDLKYKEVPFRTSLFEDVSFRSFLSGQGR